MPGRAFISAAFLTLKIKVFSFGCFEINETPWLRRGWKSERDGCKCLLSYLNSVFHLATEVFLYENSCFVLGRVSTAFSTSPFNLHNFG